MRDPLEALRRPAEPRSPDQTFARVLRARLERALALPKGIAAVMTTHIEAEIAAEAAVPPGRSVTPYLAVADARGALDWYVEVLGARLLAEPVVMPDGRVGHAELELEGARLMLSDEHPEIGVVAPAPGVGAAVTLHAEVAEVDRVVERAVAHGAALERPPGDNPYGRIGVIRDPFGHRWMLNSALPAPAPLRHGDIAYVSVHTPDADRARRFYADVVGWEYDERGRVRSALPHVGLWTQPGRPTLFCCYAVADLEEALADVRACGGRPGEPDDEPHGRVADCTDDQGTPFALWQIGSGPGTRAPANGRRPGDLAYLTLEVVDSARARAFYATVLGWRFHAGRVQDGWQVEEVAPMAGMSGGHERSAGVPMWRVDDVDAALARVRAAGGTGTEPARRPYGVTADCIDDQGTRFSLGEL